MKKLISAALLSAALLLGSCGTVTLTAADAKGKLEAKSYTVSVMSQAEAKGRIIGLNFVVDIKEALYATKGMDDVLVAFYCATADDADKIAKENIQVLVGFAETYKNEASVGSHNNVAYVGTVDAVSTAGFKI